MEDESRGYSSADAAGDSPASNVPSDREHAPNTLLNALIGGIVGIVLSFVPFSTVIGGGIAGYLEGGDSTAGAKVGALAGLVAFVPFVLILGTVLFFMPVMSGPGPRVHLALGASILLIVLFAAIYTVGLSIIGGILGVYVKEEI